MNVEVLFLSEVALLDRTTLLIQTSSHEDGSLVLSVAQVHESRTAVITGCINTYEEIRYKM